MAYWNVSQVFKERVNKNTNRIVNLRKTIVKYHERVSADKDT